MAWPWELLLVDDGSADETPARLAEVAARYGAHVRVVELQRAGKALMKTAEFLRGTPLKPGARFA